MAETSGNIVVQLVDNIDKLPNSTTNSGVYLSTDSGKKLDEIPETKPSEQNGTQENKSQPQPPVYFGRRFIMILKLMWPNWYSWESGVMLMQFALGYGYAWSYNEMSNNSGNLLTAISEEDTHQFVYWLLWIGFAAILGSFSNACIVSLGNYLCFTLFRTTLTQYLTDRYMENKAYFKMIHLDRRIEDPDTRLVVDINRMCLKIKLILFGTPMYAGYVATTVAFVYFFIVLLGEAGWFVPTFTVASFIASTIISRLLGIKPATISRTLNDETSEYHFAHTYFAMHSEHVAFLNGQEREKAKMTTMLQSLRYQDQRLAIWILPLNFGTTLFYWGNQWLCYIVPGLAWLWTNNNAFTDYTKLVNVSSTLYALLTTMTTYLLLFQEWTELVASTARVGEYIEILDYVHDDKSLDGNVEFLDSNDGTVDVSHVTLNRPGSNKVLLSDVTFHVSQGHSIVIMGPSGIGKSSLLRVIGGLWPATGGKISRPKQFGRSGIMFIPQKPYLTHDTLEAQVYYPLSAKQMREQNDDTSITPDPTQSDVFIPIPSEHKELESLNFAHNNNFDFYATFVQLLSEVGLEYLLQQFPDRNEVRNWSQVLSVGEQQRLGIARVLYHLPAVVIMDESTSAIDEPNEEKVFVALRKRRIGLLSVAHRSTVKRFHDSMLLMDRNGTWKLVPIDHNGLSQSELNPTENAIGSTYN